MSAKLSGDRQRAEEIAAQVYATAITDGTVRDWKSFNGALIERFSLTGLKRIKRRAWQIIGTER